MPARSKALGPQIAPGVVVTSGIWVIIVCVCAVAAPSTYTGGLRRALARSALVTMNAPAPSVTRQQSSLCNGDATISDASTSSTVSGSRLLARGFNEAHSRVRTAIVASCSGVVPKVAMWRLAASEYPPIGPCRPYGPSHSARGSGPLNQARPPPGGRPPPVSPRRWAALRLARGVWANTTRMHSATPAAIAEAACSR
jgi:hypothetical protein